MRSLLLLLAACSGTPDATDPVEATDLDTEVPAAFSLALPDAIPSPHTELADRCDVALTVEHECASGSPELIWSNAPANTASFVLIFDDPDAGNFSHWAAWSIPNDSDSLPREASGRDVTGAMPTGSEQLTNGFDWEGYLGSCPPAPHVYRWRLWAVDDSFTFTDTGSTGSPAFEALATAADAASLGLATACHTYGPRVNAP